MRFVILAVFSICICSLRAEGLCKSSPCIPVDIYYESLCPDSINFIKYQLVPSYEGLKDHLSINFVPYGKAHHQQISGKWTFSCQHGGAECQGNKAQACAIDAILNLPGATFAAKQSTSVKVVGCAMSSRYPPVAVPECAGAAGLSSETVQAIKDCANSSVGDSLLAAHGDKTHNLQPRLSFVPTIVLDNVYSSSNQKAALHNFKKLICEHIPAEAKPPACRK